MAKTHIGPLPWQRATFFCLKFIFTMCNQRPSTSSKIFFFTVANNPKYLRELTLKLHELLKWKCVQVSNFKIFMYQIWDLSFYVVNSCHTILQGFSFRNLPVSENMFYKTQTNWHRGTDISN